MTQPMQHVPFVRVSAAPLPAEHTIPPSLAVWAARKMLPSLADRIVHKKLRSVAVFVERMSLPSFAEQAERRPLPSFVVQAERRPLLSFAVPLVVHKKPSLPAEAAALESKRLRFVVPVAVHRLLSSLAETAAVASMQLQFAVPVVVHKSPSPSAETVESMPQWPAVPAECTLLRSLELPAESMFGPLPAAPAAESTLEIPPFVAQSNMPEKSAAVRLCTPELLAVDVRRIGRMLVKSPAVESTPEQFVESSPMAVSTLEYSRFVAVVS